MSGGVAKKDTRIWDELRAKLKAHKDAHVKVGVLESRGGSGNAEGSDITLAELAAIHEFGAPRANIPERSFLRQTFKDESGREALTKMLAKLAKAVVAERVEPRKALDMLGLWAVAQVKKRIKSNIPPPLKPETIKRKGSSTALVDTGQLLNSITSEVKE